MNTDCCWYIYEKDTGYSVCRHPDYEEDEESDDMCEGCKWYYTKDDAWADAHYCFREKY